MATTRRLHTSAHRPAPTPTDAAPTYETYIPPPGFAELAELPDAPPPVVDRNSAAGAAPAPALDDGPPVPSTIRPTRRQAQLLGAAGAGVLIALLALRVLLGMLPDAPAPQQATLAPAAPLRAALTAVPVIVEPAPAELPAFPTPAALVGWWAPDGEPITFSAPPVILRALARCGARADRVWVELEGGARVWFDPAAIALEPATVASLADDACGGN